MNILEIKEVTRKLGEGPGVDNLSLEIEEGQISCLIGPNGAGKTALLNLICGFIHPGRGHIFYRGKDITGLSPWQIAQKGVRCMFQDARIINRMTVIDNVIAAFNNQMGESAFMSVINRPKVAREQRALREKAFSVLQEVGLSDMANCPGKDLSFGQQRLLAIARLIPTNAELFLLDEPTAGLSPGLLTKKHHDPSNASPQADAQLGLVLNVIRNLTKGGKTIFIIEHNMEVVLGLAERLYFMRHGRIVFSGPPQEALSRAEIKESYTGL